MRDDRGIILKGGAITKDRRLDRLVEFDVRSRAYPITALLSKAEQRAPRSYSWNLPIGHQILDQGSEGACVGFAWAHELASRPVAIKNIDAEQAINIYRAAQMLDEWPGQEYSGTSVLAGAKVVLAKKHVAEYRWGFGLQDLVLAVGYTGPAVLGIPWYESMYEPVEAAGRPITVEVEGEQVGGHAILCIGVNVKSRMALLLNSWGPTWGWFGKAWISFDNLARLLRENGEACIPIGRR